MKIDKKCNTCGKEHKEVPKNVRPWIDEGKLIGYFWECDCKSTMFYKIKDLK